MHSQAQPCKNAPPSPYCLRSIGNSQNNTQSHHIYSNTTPPKLLPNTYIDSQATHIFPASQTMHSLLQETRTDSPISFDTICTPNQRTDKHTRTLQPESPSQSHRPSKPYSLTHQPFKTSEIQFFASFPPLRNYQTIPSTCAPTHPVHPNRNKYYGNRPMLRSPQ